MSAVEKKFYNLFWANAVCRQIFTLHKEQLLEKRDIDFGEQKRSYYLQRIILSNNQKQKISNNLIVSRIENNKIDLNDNIETTTSKYFDEAKFHKLVETHFGKAIKKIERSLSSGTFSQIRFGLELLNSLSSEEKLITFLKKFHLIPTHVNNFSQIEEILNKNVSSLITKESILEFIDSIDKISEFYTNEVYHNLLESNNFYMDILYDAESFKDRQFVFDQLYEAKIIESGINKTYYECYNCEENVFKSIATLKAKPTKISVRCPVCGKETFYLSPYRINDEIFAHITDKDGLIKFAVKHLLTEKGFTIKENFVIPPDIELDLVAFNKDNLTIILELKMFKTDTPEQTHKSNLNTAISKAIKAKQKLVELENTFKNSFTLIVTNYSDEKLIKETRDGSRAKMKEHKVKLITLDEFANYIDNHEL